MLVCPSCGNRYPSHFDRCPVDESTLADDAAATVVERVAAKPDLGPDYEVERSLAVGGMGHVWLARHKPSGLPRAVKILRGASSAGAQLRFMREAKTLLALDSPHVVKVLEVLEVGGRSVIAMERLEGETLSARLRGRTLGIGQALSVGIDACKALEAAHAAGVVHRDVKPSNVYLVRRGGAGPLPPDGDDWERAVLIDFGVAKPASRTHAQLTITGQLVGTLAYMAPEQACGQPVGFATDQFGLGATLYRALCGRAPFAADNDLEMVAKVAAAAFDPPRRLRPDLPVGVEAVLVRAMAAEPGARFPTVSVMREALVAALDDESDPRGTEDTQTGSTSTSLRERRLVTVLLTDERHGMALLPTIAESLGASTIRLGPLGSLAIFGAQASEGDEPLRALRAALRLRSAGARAGVATGHARPGVGGDVAGEVVGGAIEALRASLSQESWCDAETWRRARDRFRFGRSYRGSMEVIDELETAGPVGRTEVPLQGRAAELLRLVGVLEGVMADRRAAMAMVVGPAGIGKSRLRGALLGRIAQLVPEAETLSLRGDPTRRATPFGAFGQALAARAGVREGQPYAEAGPRLRAFAEQVLGASSPVERAESVAPLLGELCGVPFPDRADVLAGALGGPEAMRDGLRMAVGEVVTALARRAPIVIDIEDAQWLDGPSWEMCEILLGRAEALPLLIVAIARPELLDARGEPQVGDVVVVRPGTLGGADSARLAAVWAPGLSEEARGAAVARAGGNPYFLGEVLYALEAGGDVRALPPTIEAALQSRLDHLEPGDKELCKRAAVLGTVFWEGGLKALGADPTPDRMRRLRGHDLVARRIRSRFAHEVEWTFRTDLVAEGAYALVPDEDRRTLHRLAGRWLVEHPESDPEEIARHLSLGGEAIAAGRYLVDGIRGAAVKGDAETVLRLAPRALDELRDPEERAAVLAIRSEILHYAGDYEQSVRDGEEAIALLPNCAARTQALHVLARSLRTQGQVERAAEVALRAVAEARAGGDDEATARALGAVAVVAAQRDRTEEARAAAREALDLAEKAGSTLERAHALMATGYAALRAGATDEALVAYERAAAVWERVGDPRLCITARMNHAYALGELGRLEEARLALDNALDGSERIGNAHTAAWSRHNMGYVLGLLGRWDEALRWEREACEWADQRGELRLLAAARRDEVALLLWAGRAEEAETCGTECLRAATEARDEASAREARCLLAQIASARGRHADAVAIAAASGVEGLSAVGAAGFFAAWARSAKAWGDEAEARRVVAAGRAAIDRHVAQVRAQEQPALWAIVGFRDLRAVAASLGEVW